MAPMQPNKGPFFLTKQIQIRGGLYEDHFFSLVNIVRVRKPEAPGI